MAEAVKQFFVGFIHPRTWLAALIGIVAAFFTALIVGLGFTPTAEIVQSVANTLFAGNTTLALQYIQLIASIVFVVMILPYSLFTLAGSIFPVIVLVVGALVGGLIFGLVSKKERVASKSIIGGLNIAVIYLVIVVVALLVWMGAAAGSLSGFGAAAYAFVSGIWLDLLVSFLILWWVAAIISMLILSLKH